MTTEHGVRLAPNEGCLRLKAAVRTLAALDEVARRSGGGGPGVTGDHCDAVWPG
jgi:hypothetical protein